MFRGAYSPFNPHCYARVPLAAPCMAARKAGEATITPNGVGYTVLFAKNVDVDGINTARLRELKGTAVS